MQCGGFRQIIIQSTQKSAVFYVFFLDNSHIAGYTGYAFRVNKESKKTQKTASFADLYPGACVWK